MTTDKQIEIARALVATGLINKAFHSVELLPDAEGTGSFPAYKVGKEQYYVGPADNKGRFAYIRESGLTVRAEFDNTGSANKGYRVTTPCKVVIFSDHETADFEKLKTKLMNAFIFLPDVDFTSVSADAFVNGKNESPIGDYAFDATTFYIVVNIVIKGRLHRSNCPSEICVNHTNPIIK